MIGIRRKKWFGVSVTLAVFLFSTNIAIHLSRAAEPMIPRERFLAELAYYPSGKWLKAMSFGEAALIADITWVRAVQYYGEHRIQDNEFALLYHAFDVVTNFDPRHRSSYVFGGTSLAQEGKQFVRDFIESNQERFARIALDIWDLAEVGYQEIERARACSGSSLPGPASTSRRAWRACPPPSLRSTDPAGR